MHSGAHLSMGVGRVTQVQRTSLISGRTNQLHMCADCWGVDGCRHQHHPLRGEQGFPCTGTGMLLPLPWNEMRSHSLKGWKLQPSQWAGAPALHLSGQVRFPLSQMGKLSSRSIRGRVLISVYFLYS